MAELYVHCLEGCAPTPLASYLKALGVLRLLGSAPNNVTGEAADATARGWWAGERFHLRTRLDRDALLRFFLEDYAPSPIIAPWNAGSGFYYQEGKTGEKDAATGKKIKTGVRNAATKATRRIDMLARSSAARYIALAEAIGAARRVIHEFDLDEAPDPKSGQKAAFIERWRAIAGELATDWIDAALTVTGDQFDSAALLGSGGNDGNLDFSTAFQTALLTLIDPHGGNPLDHTGDVLTCALFDRAITGAFSAAVSQLAPGNSAAPNSGNGFVGPESGDSWSVALMFEGSLTFAGAATRRGEAQRARGSFPFTVSQVASGSGALGSGDDSSKRSVELWLPLWLRPATFTEIRTLFSEGRAHLGRMQATDGLTFARAVSALGVSRGIAEFVRLGFEQRYGNMFITVPLGRFRTPERPRSDLIADLEAGDWLARVRRLAREKTAPGRARAAVRRLENALFDMTIENRERDGTQASLAALGGVVSWLATSREGREKSAPPPRLGRAWVHAADDGTAEFRIAAALASLGWPGQSRESTGETREGAEQDDDDNHVSGPEDAASNAPNPSSPPAADSQSDQKQQSPTASRNSKLLPMAAHLASVEEESVPRRHRRWAKIDSPNKVWSAGSLVQNMIAVLDRRMIEQAVRGLRDKPLAGMAPARLSDVTTFLEGPPAFDDARCAALLAGLVWAQTVGFNARRSHAPAAFAYAALKPLFTPDSELRALQVLDATDRLPVPPGLVARLRRGAIDDAVCIALARARASGIGSPFDPARSPSGATHFGAGIDSSRLAAALLIPIEEEALSYLITRAYPIALPKKETKDAV